MDKALEMFSSRLPVTEGQLQILLPAGIGDLCWAWSKLWKVAEERDVTLWFPDAEQHRAGALAQMFGVKYGYMPGLTTQWVWSQPGDPEIPDTGGVLAIQPNRHLEAGKRIEKWYPDLPFKTPVPTSPATSYKLEAGTPQYIVVFMCHEGYMEGNLLPGMWARLFKEIEQQTGTPVLIIGADKDVPFAERVLKVFDPTLAPAFNVPIAELVPVLAAAKAVVGVASGITILSTYLGVRTLHGYPRWLAPMPGTWEQQGAVWDACFVDELPFDIGARVADLILIGHPDDKTGRTALPTLRGPEPVANTNGLYEQPSASSALLALAR